MRAHALKHVLFLVACAVLAPAAASAQGRAGGITEEEESFQAAEEAFKDSRDAEALRLYEKVSNINPRRGEAWLKRAVIHYKNKQYDEAVVVLDKSLELLPGDAALTGQRGLTFYRMGKVAEAVPLLEEAVGKQPDLFQVQLQLGQHYVDKLQDGKRGVAAMEAYFKHRPIIAEETDPRIKGISGSAYFLNGQFPEARRDLEIALRVNPRDVNARVSLGAVYTALGEWSRGIAVYEKLTAEAPQKPAIWLNLGTCLYKMHRGAEAEKNALEYTRARPAEARGFLLLGDVRAERGDRPGAVAAYAEARRVEPQSAEVAGAAAAREGKVQLALGDYPKAKVSLEQAVKARPDDTEALVGLADAYVATQQPKDRLVELANRLGKLDDQSSGQRATLAAARLYYAAEDDERALKQYEAAAAADAKSFRPRAGLAMTLNRVAGAAAVRRDYAAAEAALVRAHKLMPESVVTARNLGLVLMLLGKNAEAEAALKPALDRVERDLVLNRLLGRAAAAQGKRDEAIKRYETAAQIGQPGAAPTTPAAPPATPRVRGPQLSEVLAELGPLYLAAGRPDDAVRVLQDAVKEAGVSPAAPSATRNLALAQLARGLARLGEAQQAQAALDDLERAAAARSALAPREAAAVQCALALGTLKVGRPQAALDQLARAQKDGCQFKPPYDKLGPEFFNAYAAYRDGQSPARAEQAARAFQKLSAKAQGPLADLLRDLTRSAYELQGVGLYERGDRKRASAALRTAERLRGRGEQRALEHNLAVLNLEEGREGDAERVFDSLGVRPPEALVNLGVIRDRQGESKKALELYKRAVERGARSARLREWIDVKERVFARAAGGAK